MTGNVRMIHRVRRERSVVNRDAVMFVLNQCKDDRETFIRWCYIHDTRLHIVLSKTDQ